MGLLTYFLIPAFVEEKKLLLNLECCYFLQIIFLYDPYHTVFHFMNAGTD